ncbi:replication-relaxation family protein [Gordonia sp. N1V]|uniref:replication-relaxation family protein n=1 Tax=Gordonia sp. N1V TaxID=3034163 RepID=UPI0023E14E3D|nr:replication-relaxation family protein [Gordonia sp. N1V]MDF3284954.1 replication-relaxation family protein [Gordonia sp. N1V]
MLSELKDKLSERDLAILHDLENFRLLTTRQIQRLHFADGHRTTSAGTRACTRVLSRLADLGLIAHLSRRIGGVRQGSAAMTWQLAATGERLLRAIHGGGHRRRFTEPTTTFVAHTLEAAELGVRLCETQRTGQIEVTELHAERRAWQRFLGAHGSPVWLRPDLRAVTASDDFEHHWFIELDRATEHTPHLERKLGIYATYYRSGAYQAAHDLFPTVLWVAPTTDRLRQLTRLTSRLTLPTDVFRYCLPDAFIDIVIAETLGPQTVPLPGVLSADPPHP